MQLPMESPANPRNFSPLPPLPSPLSLLSLLSSLLSLPHSRTSREQTPPLGMELYQIKICPLIGAGKYECGKPVSIMSIGTPGTRKTLLVGGVNASIRLNNVLKSITMYGIMDVLCSREVCGAAARSEGPFGRLTFIPTTKVVQELHAVEPESSHRLNAPSLSLGYGRIALMFGPDNQILLHNGQTSNTYFYTLADGSAVIEPTKTEKLRPVGDASKYMIDSYSMPVFYDGTQVWLRCRCGAEDVLSSLDYDTKWTLGSAGMRLENGLMAANNVVWFADDRDSYASFSLYDIPTRTFLRKFNTFEHSVAAKNYGNNNSGSFFTPSLDGTILYLVSWSRDSPKVTILGTCTALLCVMCAARAFVPFGMRSMRLHAATLPEGSARYTF